MVDDNSDETPASNKNVINWDNWDRMVLWIIGLSIIFVPLSFSIYFWGKGISKSPSDWTDFAAFVGGLVSPIIAAGVLYYVFRTLQVQKYELVKTQEALSITSQEAIKQTNIQKMEVKIAFLKQGIQQTNEGKIIYSEHIKRLGILKTATLSELKDANDNDNEFIAQQLRSNVKTINAQLDRLNNEIEKLQTAYHDLHDQLYDLDDQLPET